ncbi:hypothetical protein PG991_013207 [Apiospora marii]|uniref:Uncharacterized protein n=1 Tax=Apiospora marii TaxID=335849 RepID=A0ABR1R5B1_9PEZI
MVRFDIVTAAVVAALCGSVVADNCKNGIDYCGRGLLRKGNYYDDIIRSLNRAGQKSDQEHVNDSVFHCGGPDDIPFQKFCGKGRCKDGGTNHNDYCD